MKKLREYAQEILDVYNYFNGIIIFDRSATAVYYYNNRPDINQLCEKDVIGKTLPQIYPELDLENSTIMRENRRPTFIRKPKTLRDRKFRRSIQRCLFSTEAKSSARWKPLSISSVKMNTEIFILRRLTVK